MRLDNREEILSALKEHDLELGQRPSDLRLVLAGYRAWGTNAFSRLVGPFAIIISDARRGRLFCARDPMGLRPLFYHRQAGRIIVASRLRQLLAAGAESQFDELAIARWLAGVRLEPQQTFFSAIKRVPAGSFIEIAPDGSILTRRFWSAAEHLQERASPQECIARFRELFFASVAARLRTLRPAVAVTVSGGFDSCAVAAVASSIIRDAGMHLKLYAFTNIAEHRPADERRFVELVARYYRLPLEICRAEEHWAGRDLSRFVHLYDEPFLPTYMSRLGWEFGRMRGLGIDVVLTGSGGDELGGNSWYLVELLRQGRWSRFWPELRERARGKGVPAALLLCQLARSVLAAAHRPWRQASRSPRLPPWGTKRMQRLLEDQPHCQPPADLSIAKRSIYQSLSTWWAEPVLSAGHALYHEFRVEQRHPFLDRRLVEWALSVSPHLMGRNGKLKAPMRLALADLMPRAIVQRADKGNYQYYWDLGMRRREKERVLAAFHNSIAAELGLIEKRRLIECYEAYCNGAELERSQLWNAYTLELWLQSVTGQSRA